MDLPFSYYWILKRLVNGNLRSTLDVGCGDGTVLAKIKTTDKDEVYGIDIDNRSLVKAKTLDLYTKLLKIDLEKVGLKPLQNRRFDLVFCNQLIEHLDKHFGESLIKEMESLANKAVVITTPNGFIPYCPIESYKNKNDKYQQHKSGWGVQDFQNKGYQVYGQGWRLVYSDKSFVRRLPEVLQLMFYVISYLLSPIFYFFPSLSHNLIAVKYKK